MPPVLPRAPLARLLSKRAAVLVGLAVPCLAALVLGAGPIAWQAGDWLAVATPQRGDLTGTTGSGSISGAGSAHALPLSDEQRGHIFDGIMKLDDAPVADLPAPAAAVPSSVPLQELPAGVTREIPLLQGYKFVKLDDRILLVSPVDRAVVAEMPRYRTLLD
jgi:Protein of unknown function (DUF1236)